MNIEWFAPLPPCRSGIAVYTSDIALELDRRAKVRYWNFWGDEGRQLAARHQVVDWKDDASWAQLNNGGLPIYNFGNNGKFHSRMWDMIDTVPGIAVIHDGTLFHLALDMFLKRKRDRAGLVRLMARLYGVSSAEALRQILSWKADHIALAPEFPMIEYVLERATAAIVHSRTLFERIKNTNSIPVLYSALPLAANVIEATNRSPVRSQFGSPLRVVVFGHLAPNRGLPSILTAIAESPHRNKISLTVGGEIQRRPDIEAQIRDLQIKDQVKITGFLEESALFDLLAASDVAVNLRNPTMGEASHSQLYLWAFRLPTLVSNTGWYAEQAEDVAVKCDTSNEVRDIKEFLARAIEQPETLLEIGRRGRDWVVANHSASGYADDIVDFASKVGRLPPWTLAKRFAARASQSLSSLDLDAERTVRLSSLVPAIKDMTGMADEGLPDFWAT